MRKRYLVLLLAALVAALVVPVGFALSLESATRAAHANRAVAGAASSVVTDMTALSASALATVGSVPIARSVPDSAKLLLVGTVLLGLAAIVRKAI
jgi:hypothetical protein